MSIALTSSELTNIQNDINDLLPDTCDIRQVSTTNDSIGQPARTYTDRATGVACRFDPLSSISLMGDEKVSSLKNYIITEGMFMLTLKNGQAISVTDQVIYNSVTYEVSHIYDDKSWLASVRCVLVRMQH